MKTRTLLVGIALLAGCLSAGPDDLRPAPGLEATDEHTAGPINRVVGDLSWEEALPGSTPNDADDVARIQTHLAWVEGELRARDTWWLPFELRFARARTLDNLHAYWVAGRFPRNAPGDPRLPRFAELGEDEPRICAVGWLYAADEGEEAALAVNDGFEHEYVEDIDDPNLLAWAAGSGLTLEELAMIQPGYDHMRPLPVDRVKALQAQLPSLGPQINACVHQHLKARDKHPEKVTMSLQVFQNGNLAQASFDLDASPQRVPVEQCFVQALQSIARVGAGAGAQKKLTQTYDIIGPLKKDGSFDARYLSVLTRGVDPAVRACADRYLPRQRLALKVVLDGLLKPAGVAKVDRFEASPAAESNASFELCARGAVTSLDAPAFKGSDVSFSVAVAVPAGVPPLQLAK